MLALVVNAFIRRNLMRVTGAYVKIGDLEHFIPDPLPPHDPPLHLNQGIMEL